MLPTYMQHHPHGPLVLSPVAALLQQLLLATKGHARLQKAAGCWGLAHLSTQRDLLDLLHLQVLLLLLLLPLLLPLLVALPQQHLGCEAPAQEVCRQARGPSEHLLHGGCVQGVDWVQRG
jgi:hypothetical protein